MIADIYKRRKNKIEPLVDKIVSMRGRGVEPNCILLGKDGLIPVECIDGWAAAGDYFYGLPLVSDGVVEESTPAVVKKKGGSTYYYY